jgi:hypothetical protein
MMGGQEKFSSELLHSKYGTSDPLRFDEDKAVVRAQQCVRLSADGLVREHEIAGENFDDQVLGIRRSTGSGEVGAVGSPQGLPKKSDSGKVVKRL